MHEYQSEPWGGDEQQKLTAWYVTTGAANAFLYSCPRVTTGKEMDVKPHRRNGFERRALETRTK